MAADYDAFHFGGVAAEGLAEEVFEASAIESTAHADDAVFGQTHFFVEQVGHGVHGVRYAHDHCVGRVFEHVVGNGFHDAGVHADEFFAGHAGFAGDTGGDNHHVGAFGSGVVVSYTFETGAQAKNAGGLHDVHGFAFGHTFFNVEENDFVGNLFCNQNVCAGGAYVAGADDCNF